MTDLDTIAAVLTGAMEGTITMTDELPSNQDIEMVVSEYPRAILERLPDCEERHRATEHVILAEKLAHRAREKAPPVTAYETSAD